MLTFLCIAASSTDIMLTFHWALVASNENHTFAEACIIIIMGRTLAAFPAYFNQILYIAVAITTWAVLGNICDSSL